MTKRFYLLFLMNGEDQEASEMVFYMEDEPAKTDDEVKEWGYVAFDASNCVMDGRTIVIHGPYELGEGR